MIGATVWDGFSLEDEVSNILNGAAGERLEKSGVVGWRNGAVLSRIVMGIA